MNNKMIVTKRCGLQQEVSFDKVIWRLKSLCDMEPKLESIDHITIAQKVISQIYSGIDTSKLDELAAEICTSNITKHVDFGTLSSRIIVSNNHYGINIMTGDLPIQIKYGQLEGKRPTDSSTLIAQSNIRVNDIFGY